VDILRAPLTCFDANEYGILILADTEESISEEEIDKIENDVRSYSLSVLIVSDWFDEILLKSSSFFDDNTHSEWYPITGGANVPSINTLLKRFGMRFGLQTFTGSFSYKNSLRVSLHNTHNTPSNHYNLIILAIF
jgi:membrane-bound transcription factor site-1 protease